MTMNATYAVASLDVAEVGVTFHCEHVAGKATYRVEHDTQKIQIYLSGTPEELGRFADSIVRAVSEHTRAVWEHARAQVTP